MMAKEYREKLDEKTNEEIYVVGCEHKLSFSLHADRTVMCFACGRRQRHLTISYQIYVYKYLTYMRWSHGMPYTHTHGGATWYLCMRVFVFYK